MILPYVVSESTFESVHEEEMGMGVRNWTSEQKAEASRRRSGNSLKRDTPDGLVILGLVNHPTNTQMFERVLSYEASMNGVTLDEWVESHRLGGKKSTRGIYLKKGMSVVDLGDQLYCFASVGARRSYVYYLNRGEKKPLSDNREEIKRLCQSEDCLSSNG